MFSHARTRTRHRFPTPPLLLEPFLRLPPESSLVLLTGTLGCCVGWVAGRFVGRLLSSPYGDGVVDGGGDGGGSGGLMPEGLGGGWEGRKGGGEGRGGGGMSEGVSEGVSGEVAVVLVSWLHDLAFWKTELRRTGGVDIARTTREGKGDGGSLELVDCFTTTLSTPSIPQKEGEELMTELEDRITAAIVSQTQQTTAAQKRKVVLVLDSPDVLLALNLCSALELHNFLLRLRSLGPVHASIVICSADLPLLSSAAGTNHTNHTDSSGSERTTPPTPLEAATAAFVVQLAHLAGLVVGVRELETGAAGDVSGVLRVTRGGGVYDWGGGGGEGGGSGDGEKDWDDEAGEGVEEMEALYLVQRDGSARVFERGSSGI
ncbi:hypothetical protein B0A55_09314 [Friedmanniomyces simplex]|uniref:Elongator complex protein 5 n=1 Tax=Friedmanniomyces simplex TaxID=329884 RepID=A0A4U0X1F3_9PEZI|nr:hypothetical protein B0A55_09314 [Friedmanniomyces simplex]